MCSRLIASMANPLPLVPRLWIDSTCATFLSVAKGEGWYSYNKLCILTTWLAILIRQCRGMLFQWT